MGFFRPSPPPHDPVAWLRAPLEERGRLSCEAWALQGYGTPWGVYLFYAAKLALYVGGFLFFCRFSPALSGPLTSWWLAPLAFQKAIVWSLLFELLGLGCGSGPLTGRYLPPVGGFLYFLRPGTTKLPFLRALGTRRTVLDALLYAALVTACLRVLFAASPGRLDFGAVALLVPLAGLFDGALFLAARAEHYWVATVCFAAAANWIPALKAVQVALWFWAGVSKLGRHFATAVCVMVSNGPLVRSQGFKKAMYRHFPDDLRPSRLAETMAALGTALEFSVAIAFLLSPARGEPLLAVALMLLLHGFIVSSVPMGVPLEWNFMVVYGAFALFWAHPGGAATFGAIAPAWLAVFLVAMLVVVPLLGNLFPAWISFLLSMRYYAGNWAGSIWLFRGDSHRRLEKLVKSSGWITEQLGRFYDDATIAGVLSRVMGIRLMHLHGRLLPAAVARAVERFEEYQWMEGEVIAGAVLGWNFGEGHLHHERLLAAVQAQCGFEPGELRCVFFESQPLGRGTLGWRIADAAAGVTERGEARISELLARQPWQGGAS